MMLLAGCVQSSPRRDRTLPWREDFTRTYAVDFDGSRRAHQITIQATYSDDLLKTISFSVDGIGVQTLDLGADVITEIQILKPDHKEARELLLIVTGLVTSPGGPVAHAFWWDAKSRKLEFDSMGPVPDDEGFESQRLEEMDLNEDGRCDLKTAQVIELEGYRHSQLPVWRSYWNWDWQKRRWRLAVNGFQGIYQQQLADLRDLLSQNSACAPEEMPDCESNRSLLEQVIQEKEEALGRPRSSRSER
jgi:hypothetical protein